MSDKKPKSIPIKDLVSEEGAHELASSPDMEPYLDLIVATMQGADVKPALEALSKLPLEKRYVWRVASAMKWGFADFDTEPVAADRDAMNSEDFGKLMELLKHRPLQFCMFLTALIGAEAMERVMAEAIAIAKQVE